MPHPEEIFSFKLGSALSMEHKLIEVLEELEQHAQRDDIKHALAQHREETREHVGNIEQCFRLSVLGRRSARRST
jgi:ferritin-like metal-binding protein YciE